MLAEQKRKQEKKKKKLVIHIRFFIFLNQTQITIAVLGFMETVIFFNDKDAQHFISYTKCHSDAGGDGTK